MGVADLGRRVFASKAGGRVRGALSGFWPTTVRLYDRGFNCHPATVYRHMLTLSRSTYINKGNFRVFYLREETDSVAASVYLPMYR